MDAKVTSKLAALELLTMEELKPIWRKYFDNDPVRFQRDYMVRRMRIRFKHRPMVVCRRLSQ